MKIPILSIIVPCYNIEPYVINSIDSIVTQANFDRVELILIDDCSTDNTLEIIRDNFIKYSNIKIIANDINQGVSVTRNRGIEESTGKYLYFFDGDDFLQHKSLNKILDHLEENIDILSFGFTIVEDRKEIIVSNVKYNDTIFTATFFLKKYFKRELLQHICSFVCKASIIKKNNILFSSGTFYAEDQEFQIKCMAHSKVIKYSSQSLFAYVRRANSAMGARINVRHLTSLDVFERMLNYFDDSDSIRGYYINYALYNYYSLVKRLVKDSENSFDYKSRAPQLSSLKCKFDLSCRLGIIVNILNLVDQVSHNALRRLIAKM